MERQESSSDALDDADELNEAVGEEEGAQSEANVRTGQSRVDQGFTLPLPFTAKLCIHTIAQQITGSNDCGAFATPFLVAIVFIPSSRRLMSATPLKLSSWHP